MSRRRPGREHWRRPRLVFLHEIRARDVGWHRVRVNWMRKVIVGQEDVINQVLNTMFGAANSLIVGAPGLAKTLLIRTIARCCI